MQEIEGGWWYTDPVCRVSAALSACGKHFDTTVCSTTLGEPPKPRARPRYDENVAVGGEVHLAAQGWQTVTPSISVVGWYRTPCGGQF